jgi:hypothetical protein
MMPGGCGNANDLLIAVTELAGLLQLELPLVNGPLLLYKAAGDLALPEVRAKHAIIVASIHAVQRQFQFLPRFMPFRQTREIFRKLVWGFHAISLGHESTQAS